MVKATVEVTLDEKSSAMARMDPTLFQQASTISYEREHESFDLSSDHASLSRRRRPRRAPSMEASEVPRANPQAHNDEWHQNDIKHISL